MSIVQRLRDFLENEKLLIRLLRSSFAVRGLGVASGFVMHVVLSRSLGAEGAGVFYLSLTLMMAAGVIGKFGLDTALMKYAGTAADQNDMAAVRGIYFQSCLISASLSVIATALLVVSAPWLAVSVFDNTALEVPIITLAFAVLPFSLIWVQSGVLKAIGRPVAATLIESALMPILMATALLILIVVKEVNVVLAGLCYLGSTVIVSLTGILFFRTSPGGLGPRKPMSTRKLSRDCAPLALIDMMNFLMAWAIFPILGSVASESEVGIFNAGHKLAIQFSVILVVFGGIMAPKFAALYASNELQKLEALVKKTTLFMTLYAIPLATLLLVWPEVVSVIFGKEFADADLVLRVLVIGQLINLVTGPCGYVLVMTGHQQTMRNILVFTLMIVLPITWYLANLYGAAGAAIATTFGLSLQNVLSLWYVNKYLGFVALPMIKRRKPVS